MKFFALVILSVLAMALGAPSDNNVLTVSEEQFVDHFANNYAKVFEEYFTKGLHALAEEICTDKNTDFKGPMEEVVRRADQVNDDSQTVCALIQDHLYQVLEPMIQAIDSCLPNSEAGVADYFVKAIVSVVSHTCHSTGEEILEWVNPCIDAVDIESSQCIQDVDSKWNEIAKTGTKTLKEVVCGEYGNARHCFESAIASKCRLQITQQSVMGVLDSVFQTPCHA